MSKTSQQLPTIKIEDYDEHQAGQHAFNQPGHMTSQPGHLAPPQTGHMTPSTGGNFEIYRHINALLENSLNLSGVNTSHQPDPTLRGAWPPSLETIPEVPLSTASQSLFNYASTGMGGAPAYPEFRLFSNTQPPITHWNPAPTLETLPRAIRGDRTPSSGYASLTESTDSLYNAGQGASLIRSLLPSCNPALPEPQMDSSQNALVNMMNLLSLESEGGKALLWDKGYYPGYPEFSMVETDLTQAAMPLMLTDADVCAIDGAARLHRNAASLSEASCTWSGTLPVRQHRNPTYSCMLFLGGVPWDITEADLQAAFGQFGNLTIEWPGKDGYVYLLFESEKSVRNLLDACTHDYSTGEYFVKISSRRMRSKEVQAIPWVIADSNYVKQSSRRLDSKKTVFVGALHGTITADGLARIMNDLFGNVIYAGIDTNKHKYPIGSGRVTFSSEKSYMKAVQAAFVKIKTPKFTKKIQIDPYLDDAICSRCNLQQGPYFCRNMACFRYFCSYCWYAHHTTEPLSHHKPLTRNTRGNYSPHFP